MLLHELRVGPTSAAIIAHSVNPPRFQRRWPVRADGSAIIRVLHPATIMQRLLPVTVRHCSRLPASLRRGSLGREVPHRAAISTVRVRQAVAALVHRMTVTTTPAVRPQLGTRTGGEPRADVGVIVVRLACRTSVTSGRGTRNGRSVGSWKSGRGGSGSRMTSGHGGYTRDVLLEGRAPFLMKPSGSRASSRHQVSSCWTIWTNTSSHGWRGL